MRRPEGGGGLPDLGLQEEEDYVRENPILLLIL
jgi:hypothetical protein